MRRIRRVTAGSPRSRCVLPSNAGCSSFPGSPFQTSLLYYLRRSTISTRFFVPPTHLTQRSVLHKRAPLPRGVCVCVCVCVYLFACSKTCFVLEYVGAPPSHETKRERTALWARMNNGPVLWFRTGRRSTNNFISNLFLM